MAVYTAIYFWQDVYHHLAPCQTLISKLQTSIYVYAYIKVRKLRYRSFVPLTSISKSIISLNFDIEVLVVRYRNTSILKILQYWGKLRYWCNPISKITSILKLKVIYVYPCSVLQYRSFRSNPISRITAISKRKVIHGHQSSVLRYRRSSISNFYWFFRPLLVLAQGSWKRMQSQYWSRWTQIAVQAIHCNSVLAQDLNQYPVRSAWQRRRGSRGEGGVADGAVAAGGARTDWIQQKPLSCRRLFVLGFIQDRMVRFTCKMECT